MFKPTRTASGTPRRRRFRAVPRRRRFRPHIRVPAGSRSPSRNWQRRHQPTECASWRHLRLPPAAPIDHHSMRKNAELHATLDAYSIAAAASTKNTPKGSFEATSWGGCRVFRGAASRHGEMRVVCEVDGQPAATFVLEDRLKPDARQVFGRIVGQGVELAIATGDRRAAAERVVKELGLPLEIEAECTPATKLELIRAKQAAGRVVGMVGDGINDAPALAQAD